MDKELADLTFAYQKTFETEEGKRVLEDIYRYTNMHESTFNPENQFATAFSEGMRRVGLRIFSYLTITPEEVRKISKARVQQQQHLEEEY